MRFGILGSLEARSGERTLQITSLKQRTLIGLLLCRANRIVSVQAITDALWPEDPPKTAHKNIHGYVSALRKVLEAAQPGHARVRLGFQPPGYVLEAETDAVDALLFQELARSGRAAARSGDPATAVERLEQARRLWRGPVLPDLVYAADIAAAAEQLLECRLEVYENWADAKLALGQHRDLVEDIGELARRHPFRERLRHAQMLALYRSGRQGEALAEYEGLRQLLARELGLEPSPTLQRLHRSILSGDPGLDSGESAGGESAGRTITAKPHVARSTADGLPRDVADIAAYAHRAEPLLSWLEKTERGGTAVVSGPVGVGKTALAVHSAHRLGERFTDGRVLVALRDAEGGPRPAGELFVDLLTGLGWAGPRPAEGGLPPDQAAALLREATAGRRVLIILDDAGTEHQVRAVLDAARDATVVVTSRRHLGGLESAAHIAVEPLSEEETLRMLSQVVGPDRVAGEPEAARRLAAVCCGLPLAVRIAGAKLAGLRHLGLGRYVERLRDDRRLWTELTVGDLQIRSRLEDSFSDLSHDEQAAVRSLGRLADPTFTTAEAADALGTDAERAEAAIEQLIEAYFVHAHPAKATPLADRQATRYRLLPLIRAVVRQPIACEGAW